ncbi:MAG: hypothetical protein HRU31_17330 [Rhodobacteraceae bacterium]|nr:hypothetical protein [Paracoccaceae bacterium]
MELLEAAELVADNMEDGDMFNLYERWQLPMYELQITPTIQALEELREAQLRMLKNEIGGW